MNIGHILKRLRLERFPGMKQSVFCKRIGVTGSYLSLLENGKKFPSRKTLDLIARELDVPSPILVFLALEKSDIKEGRSDAFMKMKPQIDALISAYFLNESDEQDDSSIQD